MNMHAEFHRLMDENTVVIIVACVVGVNLYYFDKTATTVAVPVMSVLCVLLVVLNSALRRLLNHARPPGTRKTSAGMPSNHAAALLFLAIVACEGLERGQGGEAGRRARGALPPPATALLQHLVLAYALYGAALRVVFGAHTAAQVLVGGAVGFGGAVGAMRANYAGYTGPRAGGRIDDLAHPLKVGLLYLSVAIIGCTVKVVAASYKKYIVRTKYRMKQKEVAALISP